MANSPKVLEALNKVVEELTNMPQEEFEKLWAENEKEWERKKVEDPEWVDFINGCARSLQKDNNGDGMENGIIKSVTESKDFYDIVLESGVCFGLSAEYGVAPKKGDEVTLHTKNWSNIRGLDLNGQKVFYKSDEDLEREHKQYVEEKEQKDKEVFARDKADLDAKYEALPECFKKRIDKFRNNNPDFRWKYESYEMFCCTQAVAIAEELKTSLPGKEEEFEKAAKSWDMKVLKKFIPSLSEEHSNNTYGCAMKLGQMYYHGQEDNIIKLHGALAPLVGSKEYGCV